METMHEMQRDQLIAEMFKIIDNNRDAAYFAIGWLASELTHDQLERVLDSTYRYLIQSSAADAADGER